MIERKGGHIMARYRIRIECLDGSEELDAEYRAGIECEGFALISRLKDGFGIGIEHMSIDNISDAMRKSDKLLQSAILADAMARIQEIEHKGNALKAFFNNLDI